MHRNEYFCEPCTQAQEKVVRTFLLKKSNIVRLTAVTWSEISWFKIRRFGGHRDLCFREIFGQLKPFFLKKVVNNKRYNNIVQSKRSKFTHYFFMLSPEIKKKLQEETLFWTIYQTISKYFYGFEDPVFYSDEIMIGSVITHMRQLNLFLRDEEKKALEMKSVKLLRVVGNKLVK